MVSPYPNITDYCSLSFFDQLIQVKNVNRCCTDLHTEINYRQGRFMNMPFYFQISASISCRFKAFYVKKTIDFFTC